MPIQIIPDTTSYWATPADVRVNAVNCVGVMGKGIALEFRRRYPSMYKDYLQTKLTPGTLHMYQHKDTTIINLPTKVHWRDPSEYDYIKRGLGALRVFLSNKPTLSVVVPALGCGNGGLDWDKVAVLVEQYLGDLPNTIYLFAPHQ